MYNPDTTDVCLYISCFILVVLVYNVHSMYLQFFQACICYICVRGRAVKSKGTVWVDKEKKVTKCLYLGCVNKWFRPMLPALLCYQLSVLCPCYPYLTFSPSFLVLSHCTVFHFLHLFWPAFHMLFSDYFSWLLCILYHSNLVLASFFSSYYMSLLSFSLHLLANLS